MKKCEKIIKKVKSIKIFCMILLLMVVSVAGIIVVNAATPDTKPPVLKSISFKNPKKSYNMGEKVYLNIDANDDISGIGQILFDFYTTDGIDQAYVNDIGDNPYFIVPRLNMKEDNITVGMIRVYDNAGNEACYTIEKNHSSCKYYNYNMNFKAVYTGSDYTGPELVSISANKTTIKYGESVGITIEATDDLSGVKSAEIGFALMHEDGSGHPTFYKTLKYDKKTKQFKADISAPPFNGKYEIFDVRLIDNSENLTLYEDNPIGSNKELTQKISFSVTSAPDSFDKDIKISKIDYKYKKLVAPSIYEIGIKLNKDIDYIEQVNIMVCLKSKSSCSTTVYLFKDDDGYYRGYLDVDQFSEKGIYQLKRAWLYVDEDNEKLPDYWEDFTDNLEVKATNLFEVVTDNTYDVITSTIDKDMLLKIKSAKDNAKIAINSLSDSILKKEVFEAIQNTNKTIYVESDGIQWVFKGQDITNPKDIDTSVYVSRIYEDELNDKIGNYLDRSIVVDFANNGKLPGIALIKVKTDYVLREYLGTEDLQVYYYNGNDNQMFDEVANNISITDEGNLEFYVTHNSSFVISNKKVDSSLISNSKKDLKANEEMQDNSKFDSSIDNKDNGKNNIFTYIAYSVAGLSIIGLVVCTVILVKRKKKNRTSKDKLEKVEINDETNKDDKKEKIVEE